MVVIVAVNPPSSRPELPAWFANQWYSCGLRVLYASGDDIAQSREPRRRRPRSHWSFYVVDDGRIRASGAQFDLVIPSGHSVLLPPSDGYHESFEPDGDHLRLWVIDFRLVLDVQCIDPLSLLPLPQVIPMRLNQSLRHELDGIASCYWDIKAVDRSAPVRARYAFDALLLTYLEGMFANKDVSIDASNPPKWLTQLTAHIAKNFRFEDANLDQLAKISNYSPGHIRKAFLRYYGRSPRAYLLQHLIGYAKRLLASNRNLNIEEVSEYCRFKNSSHFCRVFKQHVGMTPRAWRRSLLGADGDSQHPEHDQRV